MFSSPCQYTTGSNAHIQRLITCTMLILKSCQIFPPTRPGSQGTKDHAIPCRFLLQMDLGNCRARQAAASAMESLEQSVASPLGLSFIVAAPSLSPLAPHYRSFLEGLASAASTQGPIFPTSAPWVGLRITGTQT